MSSPACTGHRMCTGAPLPLRPSPVPVMRTVYLGLGSNRGDRFGHLQAAVDGLACTDDTAVTDVSGVFRTEAHVLEEEDEQPDFFNAVVAIRTRLRPEALLERTQALERAEGRPPVEERRRWAPRVLDIDLLVMESTTRDSPGLTLPHPRLAERRFVLVPLAELNPDLWIPEPVAANVRDLLDRCPDESKISRVGVSLQIPEPDAPAESDDTNTAFRDGENPVDT